MQVAGAHRLFHQVLELAGFLRDDLSTEPVFLYANDERRRGLEAFEDSLPTSAAHRLHLDVLHLPLGATAGLPVRGAYVIGGLDHRVMHWLQLGRLCVAGACIGCWYVGLRNGLLSRQSQVGRVVTNWLNFETILAKSRLHFGAIIIDLLQV